MKTKTKEASTQRVESNVLDDMLDDANERRDRVRELSTACGRTLQVREQDGTTIELHAPDGRLEVSIRLDADGPKVSVAAAALRIETPGAVKLDCETLELHARTGMGLRCDRGSIDIDAGDDVVVTGERVRLN